MKREKVKTLVLSLLIVISLFFTWSIWTYQPTFDLLENMKYLENKPLTDEKREIGEVVKPQQAFFHDGSNHYAVEKSDEIWNRMAGWDLGEANDLTKSYKDDSAFLNFVHGLDGNKKLELVFSQTIPAKTFQKILDWNSKNVINGKDFDGIIIPFERVKTPRMYFVSYKNKEVMEVEIKHDAVTALRGQYFSKYKEFPRYFAYPINKDFVLMLPEENPVYSRYSYSIRSTYNGEDFKQALFNNPYYVTRGNNGMSETVYTDTTSRMNMYYERGEMVFTNLNVDDDAVRFSSLPKVMEQSLGYLNAHGGWTDDYVFFSHTKKLEISLRMMISGLPVFASFENPLLKTDITQSWGSADISRYAHPIYRLGIPDNQELIEIENGREIISALQESTGELNVNNVVRVFPAYELTKSEELNVVLNPVWYAETTSGNYRLIEDPKTLGGGSRNGLE